MKIRRQSGKLQACSWGDDDYVMSVGNFFPTFKNHLRNHTWDETVRRGCDLWKKGGKWTRLMLFL